MIFKRIIQRWKEEKARREVWFMLTTMMDNLKERKPEQYEEVRRRYLAKGYALEPEELLDLIREVRQEFEA